MTILISHVNLLKLEKTRPLVVDFYFYEYLLVTYVKPVFIARFYYCVHVGSGISSDGHIAENNISLLEVTQMSTSVGHGIEHI